MDSLYETAQRAYAEGRYAAAAELLEEAYRREPAPVLQHNLGRCYERLEQPERAVIAYRIYLGSLPVSEERTALEQHVTELEAELAREPEPDPVPTAARELPIERPSRGPDVTLAVTLGGIGIALGLAGGALALAAFAANPSASATSSADDVASQLDLANALGASATIAWSLSGVLVVSAIVMLAIELTGGPAPEHASESFDVRF